MEVKKIIDKLRARAKSCDENNMPGEADGINYAAQLLGNMIARDIEPEPHYEEVASERKVQEICSN